MRLTDDERQMADGTEGEAIAAAMRILVDYGEILGAERLVPTDNVCGANIFGPRHSKVLGTEEPDTLFSRYSLASDRPLEVPAFAAHSCQLIGPRDPEHWRLQGISAETNEAIDRSERYLAAHGVNLLNTCTPYQAGNVPRLGEHCAWMESSAVVYINSVLGARSNVEGRESAAAAMLTGRIPYWGFHTPEHRRATHVLRVETPVEDTYAWNVLGYFAGGAVGDDVVVLDGPGLRPDAVDLKQFGAAAASSGDVEMYHIPGVTPEARSVEDALGGRAPERVSRFGRAEFEATVESLNATAHDTDLDFVMLGCPHASLNQLRDIARLLEGRRIAEHTALWVFTPRSLRETARRNGYVEVIEAAGGRVLSDTCPAIAQFLPPGTRVFATDSAKQAHYLPAIMGVQGRFGSTTACVEAAVAGRWQRD
ncbi:aconitase X [Streptomyces halstedii]|uniref:aconitase X n=1 Tax=Streptomyces halstedii TaxID=1944 RepID=UPI00364CE6CB